MRNDLDNNPNKKSWCSLVRDLLCNLGFHDARLFQDVGQSDVFISMAKQRIRDQFIQNWNSAINDSSRAIFYKHICEFKLQPYLNVLTVPKFRIAMTKLRVSSHRLHIETGRWTKPNCTPYNLRVCNQCNIIEDEFHFVCECELYNDLRSKYISNYYRVRHNMAKFVELITSDNEKILKRLSIFIHKAFQIRRETYTNNQ